MIKYRKTKLKHIWNHITQGNNHNIRLSESVQREAVILRRRGIRVTDR